MNLSALDHDGKPVDWWFAYKVPVLHPGAGTAGATGYEYAFMDSTMAAPVASGEKMAHDGSLSKMQVDAALKASGYILYNDERPDGKDDNESFGHCKGVIAWDRETGTGFWLIHSWPLYPDIKGRVPVGDYGQTFLCLSLTLDALRDVASMLRVFHEAQVYASLGVEDLAADDPLLLLAKKVETNGLAASTAKPLETVGGMSFTAIAKNRKWNDDFWNDLVGVYLGVDIDVETWIRGPIAPTADAGGLHTTTDVKFVNAGPLGLHFAWPETHDHAKWAISVDPNQPWVCVGDINRMISQRKRGGGCVAFQHLGLWSALKQSGLVMAPAGMSREEAHAHIQKSHKAAAQAA